MQFFATGLQIEFTINNIAPGHDAWVVGNDDVAAYKFAGMWA